MWDVEGTAAVDYQINTKMKLFKWNILVLLVLISSEIKIAGWWAIIM